jgi:hypothetical protein
MWHVPGPRHRHQDQRPHPAAQPPRATRSERLCVLTDLGDLRAKSGRATARTIIMWHLPGPRHRHQDQRPHRAVQPPRATRSERLCVLSDLGDLRAKSGPATAWTIIMWHVPGPRHRHHDQRPHRAAQPPRATRSEHLCVLSDLGDLRAKSGAATARTVPVGTVPRRPYDRGAIVGLTNTPGCAVLVHHGHAPTSPSGKDSPRSHGFTERRAAHQRHASPWIRGSVDPWLRGFAYRPSNPPHPGLAGRKPTPVRHATTTPLPPSTNSPLPSGISHDPTP